MEDELLTLAEVARALRVSYQTAARLVQSRDLPSFRVRRLWRIWRRDLDAYMQRERQAGVAQSGRQDEREGGASCG